MSPASGWRPTAATALLVALTCLLATQLFQQFLTEPRTRWVGLLHDRNGHYLYGLNMAVALERRDVGRFLTDLEKGVTWPPLHGLLVAATQLGSGNDWRMAVLPSLLGWLVMLLAVFAAARLAATGTGLGLGAGAIAFTFAALSPAHRVYATDCMLESLGAGLTMLALATHARALEQEENANRWRVFALVLTLLFFEKYNYWMIAALALLAAHAPAAKALFRQWNWRQTLARQLRQPLNWLAALLALLLVLAYLHSSLGAPAPGGNPFRFAKPLLYAFYLVVFLSLALQRRTFATSLRLPARILYRWHVLPIAIYFLLPKRLSGFVGFISPANYGDSPVRNFLDTIRYYAAGVAIEYHAAPWMALVSFALALCAPCFWRKLGPSARAILLCGIIGAFLTILHPNQKTRYMHTWLPAVWAASGLGAALLAQRLARFHLAGGAMTLGAAGLALAHPGAWRAPGFAEETGTRAHETRSLLDLSDRWLAEIAPGARVAFVSTQNSRGFFEWTFLQRTRDRTRFQWPRWPQEATPEQMRHALNAWLRQPDVDILVVVEIPPDTPEFAAATDLPLLRAQLPELLASQSRFVRTKEFTDLKVGARISLWRALTNDPSHP